MYLRAADEPDAPALAELRAASLCEMNLLEPSARPPFVAEAAANLARLFRAQRMMAWVACDDERLVGSCCAVFYDRLPYPEGSLHAEVSGVYVAPPYRRRGIAAELVREVVAAVRSSGVRKTFLRPSATARALYERLGFTVDGVTMALD